MLLLVGNGEPLSEISKDVNFLKFIFIYVHVCLYGHMNADVCRGHEKVSDALELELQAAVSCPTWVLAQTSSGRKPSALGY